MIDLAIHHGNGAVALKDVARRQAISEKYLWQVLTPLKTAGLIASTRGAKGGYTLSRRPSKITVRDIVTTIEGEDLLVARGGSSEAGDRGESAAVQSLWKELEDKLSRVMDGITLQDLVDRQRAAEEATAPSYAI